MKSYALSIQKGGTGKTSIAVTLAAELSKNGKTILLDCDPQGSATSWILPLDSEMNFELADILINPKTTNIETVIKQTALKNLDIIPTAGLDGKLKLYADTKAAAEPFSFARILKELESKDYKFAVLDLSPSFGLYERNILTACDEVITPIIPDYFGIDGIEIFIKQLGTAKEAMNTEKPAYKKIIINALDKRISQQNEYTAELLENDKMQFFKIPVDPIFRKAQRKNLAIQQLTETKAETTAEITRLAETIIKEF